MCLYIQPAIYPPMYIFEYIYIYINNERLKLNILFILIIKET